MCSSGSRSRIAWILKDKVLDKEIKNKYYNE
jgi:hypothetical protein